MLAKIRLNVCQTRCTNQHVLPSIRHHRSYRQSTSHNVVEELGRNIGQGFGAVEYTIHLTSWKRGGMYLVLGELSFWLEVQPLPVSQVPEQLTTTSLT